MKISLTGLLDDGTPRAAGVGDPRGAVTFPQGSDVQIDVTVLRPSGTPVSLAGGTLSLTVQRKPAERWPRIAKAAVISGATGTFAITPAETKYLPAGKYVYDVWLTLAGKRDAVIPASPLVITDTVTPVPT